MAVKIIGSIVSIDMDSTEIDEKKQKELISKMMAAYQQRRGIAPRSSEK